MTGQTIGHYRILERIGHGGMGEVYLAEDLKLKRKAAIKFISAHLVSDDARRQRFIQEATIAASVDHPHVAAIYEVDHAEGHTYIAMEYVRGQTLRTLLFDGALPLKRVLDLSIQIADALAKVHHHGVTHRDLKPENVIVSEDGYAKIIDFGLAKLVDHAGAPAESETVADVQVRTADGLVLGTVAYMSPEQARGAAVDARSDIFSFGVVLHELLTGTAPFKRGSAAETLSAILTETPLAPMVPDVAVSPELQRIVRKCLVKDANGRYQSMRDVVVDLRAVRDALGSSTSQTIATPTSPALPRLSRRRLMLASAAILASAGIFALWFFTRTPAQPVSASLSGRRAIAVMNFQNLSGGADIAWLSSGLSSMLVTGLAQSPEVEVITTDRLNDAARQVGKDRFDAIDAGARSDVIKRAGGTFVVNGTIVKAADELRIDARVEDLSTGRVVLAENVRGTDPLNLADTLAARIRAKLDVRTHADVRPVAEISSKSVEAYRLYALGIDALDNVRTADAEKLFNQAIAIDADFAMARIGLSVVADVAGRSNDARKHLNEAAAHLNRLSERDALLVRGGLAQRDGRLDEALQIFETLLAKYPDTVGAYISAYFIQNDFKGDPSSGLEIMERATRAMPTSGPVWNLVGYAYLENGRPDLAISAFERYVQLRPSEPNAIDSLAEGRLAAGDLAGADKDTARAIAAGHPGSKATLSWVRAVQGRLDESLETGAQTQTANIVALAHLGRHREAEKIRKELSDTARQNQNALRQVNYELLRSMLALDRGDCAAALSSVSAFAVLMGNASGIGDGRNHTIFAHLIAGTCEARTGDLKEARARLDAARGLARPTVASERWWTSLLEAEIALASGDAAGASEVFRRAEPARTLAFNRSGDAAFRTMFSHSLILRDGLARALAAQGKTDEALAAYRRLLVTDRQSKLIAFFEPRYLLPLARLLDKAGKKPEARQEYQRFLDYWKKADAGAPEVAEAKKALAR